MAFVLFIVYAIVSIFTPQEPLPSPTPVPLRSNPPVSPVRPLETSLNPPATDSVQLTPNGPSEEELVDLLPIQTDTFNVEYLSVIDRFVVTIKKNPYQVNKTQAEDWFKGFGFDPKNLNIYWRAFPEVKR